MPNNNDPLPIPDHMLPIMRARSQALAEWFFSFVQGNPLKSETTNVTINVEFKDGLCMQCDLIDLRNTHEEMPVIPPVVVKRKGGVN